MMKAWIYCWLFPHFLQSLNVAAMAALLPIIDQSRKPRMAAALAAGFVVGGVVEYINLQIRTIIGWQVLYYILPLMFAFGAICFVAENEYAERVYALSMAYLVQHIAFCLAIWLDVSYEASYLQTLLTAAGKWMFHLIVLLLAYRLVFRKLPEHGHYHVTLRSACVTFVMVLLVALGLNYFFRNHLDSGVLSYYIGFAYDICCCAFLLWIQVEQRHSTDYWMQLEIERKLRLQMRDQYEQSHANVAVIHQKCHDLKHQISALRTEKDPVLKEQGLREIEEAALMYDALADTGNEVLDTVLTEKNLICEKEGIECTCMADGNALSFMRSVDLYTLFGNALDNAVEACRNLDDPEKKTISVIVRQRNGTVLIQIENYYTHELIMEDGLPQTTKANTDDHGYGMKSIAAIAGKYEGTIDVRTDDGLFLLSIIIPIPIKG